MEEENSEDGSGPVENFRISEINARFSFNGFMFATCGQQAIHDMGICDNGNGLVGATDPAKVSQQYAISSFSCHYVLTVFVCDKLTETRSSRVF